MLPNFSRPENLYCTAWVDTEVMEQRSKDGEPAFRLCGPKLDLTTRGSRPLTALLHADSINAKSRSTFLQPKWHAISSDVRHVLRPQALLVKSLR